MYRIECDKYIHLCNLFHTNIFGHSFVSKFSQMSHSVVLAGRYGTRNIATMGNCLNWAKNGFIQR